MKKLYEFTPEELRDVPQEFLLSAIEFRETALRLIYSTTFTLANCEQHYRDDVSQPVRDSVQSQCMKLREFYDEEEPS